MDRKRGYYIHFDGIKTSGVAKKIQMQIHEFQKISTIEEISVEDVPRNLFQRIVGLFPLASISRKYDEALKKIENPDYVYIRRTVADKGYTDFLKKIKVKYPDCKIIVEIFTYPYNRDSFGQWNTWPFYFKELIYRKKLKEAVDRFVTYSRDKEIYGVPCICTMNGIDLQEVKPVAIHKRDERKIRMLAVANFQRHHGYERVLEGLYKYRGEREFELYLVGEGKEMPKYKRMIRKWHLEDSVYLCGKKLGEELDCIYEKADIALASFGLYKLNISSISTLKTSEYIAKGLPVIAGCSERAMEESQLPYFKIFVNHRGAIDMEEVVKFYDVISQKKEEDVIKEIRNYAKEKISIDRVLQPIIDYIMEEK